MIKYTSLALLACALQTSNLSKYEYDPTGVPVLYQCVKGNVRITIEDVGDDGISDSMIVTTDTGTYIQNRNTHRVNMLRADMAIVRTAWSQKACDTLLEDLRL